ncbi:hypothetical protein TWF703_000046 [Orbilia oligospora]|uniref:Nineteen complex-related protein 2 domain-containing protein n=1 Tax=Orbilia oligospora TaxID=2813651 RepID=A0A7C8JWM7_ORBOL|nr:hypothetical protein TWF703_000046 [Orbilia oligospora]
MKSANFASRKPKARIIASFEDDELETPNNPKPTTTAAAISTSEPTDSSPLLFKRKSASTKTRKTINRSLISLEDPHAEDNQITEKTSQSTDTPELTRPIVIKKSTLSRQNNPERSASSPSSLAQPSTSKDKPRPTLKKSTILPSQPFSQLSLTSRPSYSKEALAELKGSTPTTPLHRNNDDDTDISMSDAPPPASKDPLDVAGKFAVERASAAAAANELSIPDSGTIKALKARRALLAQNPDYISLSDDVKKGSRLQKTQDDEEEILETFVEDGGLALGKRAEKEKERRRREDIREAIDMVERPSDEDEEDSNDDGNGEWEANRLRTGGYGSNKRETLEEKLRKPPAVITPLPNFQEALANLKGILAGMNDAMEQKSKRVEELLSEKEMIEQREKELQKLLKETSEKYEQLRAEAGTALHVGRGLESFGDDTAGNGIPAGV